MCMKKFNLNKLIHSKIYNSFNFLKSKKVSKFLKKYKYIILCVIIILLIVRTLFAIYLFNYKYTDEQYFKSMNLLIISKDKITDSCISYLVKIEDNKEYTDNFILNIYKDKKLVTELDNQLFYKKYSDFKYGDVISVKGKITIPKKLNNLHEFDYKKYLNSRNIIATITTYGANKISKLQNNILTYIYKFRDKLEYTIDTKFSKDTANLFKSMIYGDDSNLSKEIKDNFTKLGISHLLAVSGSNVGVVTFILYYIFKKLKVNSFVSVITTSFILFSFCVISGFEISLIRASIISIITMITFITNIKLNKFFSIFFALTLIVIYNPFCIFNVSLILSFTAFTGLLLFSKQIQSYGDVCITKLIGLNNVINIRKRDNKLSIRLLYKFLKSIVDILSLYFSVQILILPIQIYFFHSFTVVSILSNLVIYFFSSIQLIFGYLFVFLNNVSYLSDLLANINNVIINVIIQIVNVLASIDPLKVKLPTPDMLSILCYYILVIYLFYGYKIMYYFKYMYRKINVKVVSKVVVTLCIAYILLFNIYTTYVYSFVYYFNVEQGNMALIKSGTKTILVDIGTSSKINLTSILQNFLDGYNIDKIDYLLVTHLHSDHINGLFELEEKLINNEIRIESVIYSIPKYEDKFEESSYVENSISYNMFKEYLNKMKIKQIIVEKWDNLQIDNNVSIDILNPKDKEAIKSKDIVNSNSIISLITIKKSHFLFMGDSTKESEKVMIDDIYNIENKDKYFKMLNDLNAVQIGHHGSNTSSSEYFIKNISTKLAVISSKKSVYGHPSSSVVNILKRYIVNIKVTEESGGILVNIDFY